MWGAALGVGAAFLGGFFTGGLTWSLIPITAAGLVAGAGGEGALNWLGDNLLNQAKKSGLSEEHLLALSKMDRKTRDKFVEEQHETLKQNNERLEELEKNLTKLAGQLKNESDPAEKARLTAMINEMNAEKRAVLKENTAIRNDLKDVLKRLGDNPLTEAQLNIKKHEPFLNSPINWVIIGLAVLLGLVLVNFVKKLFSNLFKGIS